MVGGAGEQVERHRYVRKVDAASANSDGSVDQLIVTEQMADDPQVERSRHVVGVLEPVLELAIPGDVVLVVEVQQQVDLSGDLGAGLDQDEPRDHVLPLENASISRDERLVEAQISTWSEVTQHLVNHRLASVEIDRSSSKRERIDLLGIQRRVDRRQPATLTVADQVHAPTAVRDRPLNDLQVILDRRVLGLFGFADPIERQCALEARGENCPHLALLG